MYDLNLMPIHLHRELPAPSGSCFKVVPAPRRAARVRAEDVLIIALRLGGSIPVTPENLNGWMDSMAQAYFKTSGTVTAALRSLIETFNLILMERNLKSSGDQRTGAINLAVVHRESLYLAQSGLTHAYVLNQDGLQHHTDTTLSDRGLGLSRTPTIRYYQDDLGKSAYFFVAETPPVSWTETQLHSDPLPRPDQLRRRLLNQAPADFEVTLVQFVPGQGQVTTVEVGPHRREQTMAPTPKPEREEPVQPKPIPTEHPEPAGQTLEELLHPPKKHETPEADSTLEPPDRDLPKAAETQTGKMEAPSPAPTSLPTPPVNKPSLDQPANAELPVYRPATHLRSETVPAAGQAEARSKPKRDTGAAARAALDRQKAQVEENGLQDLAKVLKWLREAREKISAFFKDVSVHWSPGGTDSMGAAPQRSPLLVAVVVPLVVVAVAVGVYLVRGQAQQYDYYYSEAIAYAEAAASVTDPAAARSGWEQAIVLLDQAALYRSTDEVKALRGQAENALDYLDGAVRLDYRPALTEALYDGITITRIAPFGSDLYLLDEAGGRVIHATRQSQGYQVNPEFVCTAGTFGGQMIGPLVDMVSLPIANIYQAHVMAVDALGNVIYCAAGQDPLVVSLPAPTGGVGAVTAISYNSGYLYVLDPVANAIRVYQGTNGQFLQSPSEFFEGTDPANLPDLTQVIDMSANGLELYLLRMDGLMADCLSSGFEDDPVDCENPVAYIDGRAGLEEQPVVMPEGVYTSVLYSAPPDPTVNVLDASHGDIYRFSLRFRLNQRLRPEFGDYELESNTATAFTLGPDQVAFIAYEHQLFFAYVN